MTSVPDRKVAEDSGRLLLVLCIIALSVNSKVLWPEALPQSPPNNLALLPSSKGGPGVQFGIPTKGAELGESYRRRETKDWKFIAESGELSPL